jgi:CBS domain-containing protein
MTRHVSLVTLAQTVGEAARLMRAEDVGAVPVLDREERVVAMLTDRDIVVRVVAEGRDPQATHVDEVASRELVTVAPQQELDEAIELMAAHQLRRLPVVAGDGRLVGILGQADVAQEARPQQAGAMVEKISQQTPPSAPRT